MKLWIHGITGRIGQLLVELLDSNSTHQEFELLGGSNSKNFWIKDKVFDFPDQKKVWAETLAKEDVYIIDFTSPAGTKMLSTFLADNKISPKTYLVATTGTLENEPLEKLAKDSRVLIAPNTSTGIHTLCQQILALPKYTLESDTEIVEWHHRHKKDRPSGTALLLLNALNKARQKHALPEKRYVTDHGGLRDEQTVGIHCIRGGEVPGRHEIHFFSGAEELCLSHTSGSRQIFAEGALHLTQKMAEQQPFFSYLLDWLNQDI